MTETYLEHHGILGMKWGVRRYQNKDGTLTSAGRKHREHTSSNETNDNKKKIIKGLKIAAGVAGVAATTYAFKNPEIRKILKGSASDAAKFIKKVATDQKTKDFVKKTAATAVKDVTDTTRKTGKAMMDAATITMGTIKIAQVTEKFAVGPNATKEEQYNSLMKTEVAKAAIKSLYGIDNNSKNNSNKGNSNKNGSVGKDVSDKIGKPSNKGVDKQSSEYQDLFKGQDADTRSTIKSLISAGYDIDQVKSYLGHSGIHYKRNGVSYVYLF